MADYRIYCTIYAVCLLFYASSIALIGTKRRVFGRDAFFTVFGGSVIAATLTGFVQYLDWIWP